MIIYFDETYDNGHDYLILAALFNPSHRSIHRAFMRQKRLLGFCNADGTTKELKYTLIKRQNVLEMARRAVDVFVNSDSFFRCIVIDQSRMDVDHFGKPQEPESLKRARAYKKFAELLIARNCGKVTDATLLVDELTRCKGDKFIERMKDEFCIPFQSHSQTAAPVLTDVMEIRSHLDQYHVNQINDVLAGCVLNNLKPAQNDFKNAIRNYLINKLGVADLLESTWGRFNFKLSQTVYPKFNIWYWRPQKT